jgi:hypothetical protein
MDFLSWENTINIYIPEGYTIEKVPTPSLCNARESR